MLKSLIYIVNKFRVRSLFQWWITRHPNSLHYEDFILLTKSCYWKGAGGKLTLNFFIKFLIMEPKLNSFQFLQTVRLVYKTNSLRSVRPSNQADEIYSCYFEMHHKYMQDHCVALNNSSGDSVGKMEFSDKHFSMHQWILTHILTIHWPCTEFKEITSLSVILKMCELFVYGIGWISEGLWHEIAECASHCTVWFVSYLCVLAQTAHVLHKLI